MTTVLILAASATQPAGLAEAVERFHELGATVHLASRLPLSEWGELNVDEAHYLGADIEDYPPAYWRQLGDGTFGEQMWRLVRRSSWVRKRAARADVLVAMDPGMIFSVWNLARTNRRAHARYGLHPAITALVTRPLPPRRARTVGPPAPEPTHQTRANAVAQRLRRVAGRLARAGGLRRPAPVADTSALAPGLTDVARVRRGVREVVGHIEATRLAEARTRAEVVAAAVSGAEARADLWGSVVARDLAAGRSPAFLADAADAELALSDELLARDEPIRAAGSFIQATRLLFHRAAHMDAVASPLSEDPAGYTVPLYRSATYRQLSRRRGRATSARTPAQDATLRVAIVTDGNVNFVRVLHRHLDALLDVEVRLIDPTHLERASRWLVNRRALVASELAGDDRARDDAEADLREHLDWADVVFVDWATNMAHYVTLADPGTARIIVRLHSYEAWTLWPHLIDWSRVDRLVFVSDHLAELTTAAVPALGGPGGPGVHVVPNAMDLKPFVLPKEAGARFTVAVLGYNVVAKDVRWALHVARRLRQIDPRYRLLLIGGDFSEGGTPAFRAYRDAAQAEMAALEAEGGLLLTGRTEDVPGALRAAGVILSSSVREGSPLAVVEGAASGAVPVVRDWPFFARLEHGPRLLYPEEWVVETVAQAVERIVAVTHDEEEWATLSRAVSAAALESLDIDVTRRRFQELFVGES